MHMNGSVQLSTDHFHDDGDFFVQVRIGSQCDALCSLRIQSGETMFKVAEGTFCGASNLLPEFTTLVRETFPDLGKAPSTALYLENINHDELSYLLDMLYARDDDDLYVANSCSSRMLTSLPNCRQKLQRRESYRSLLAIVHASSILLMEAPRE